MDNNKLRKNDDVFASDDDEGEDLGQGDMADDYSDPDDDEDGEKPPETEE